MLLCRHLRQCSKMSSNKFPYSIKPLDARLDDKIKTLFLGQQDGSVVIGPKKFVHRFKYGAAAETIYNFEVRPDDVWVVTMARSGTTVTQEMAWLILNDDYDTAAKVVLNERFFFLEFSTLVSDELATEVKKEIGEDQEKLSKFYTLIKPQWEVLENIPGRRYIKSHLPLSLLPPAIFSSGAKVIYVARNPKDAAISQYHQNRSLRVRNFIGNFETYWDLFENNLISSTPYWENLEEGWGRRHNKNFLFLFYEDIIKDYRKTIIKVADFLEKTINEEQISKLADYLHIDNFRKNQHTTINIGNFFSVSGPYQHVRKGKSGQWDECFTKELNERANEWIEANYKNTTLRFPINLV